MSITVCDVTLRDGLQSISKIIDTENKFKLFCMISSIGVEEFEFTSFVSPKVVPQLSDSQKLADLLLQKKLISNGVTSLALNLKGIKRALEAGVFNQTLVVSASEKFSLANTGMTLDQMRDYITTGSKLIKTAGGRFRGSISMSFGEVGASPDYELIYSLVELLVSCGAYEVSFADTVANACTKSINDLIEGARARFQSLPLNLHLHGNPDSLEGLVSHSLDLGIQSFDVSLLGAGGCPNVDGHSGNLSYRTLLSALDKKGILSNLSIESLGKAEQFFSKITY